MYVEGESRGTGYSGSPEKMAAKPSCVCVCVCVCAISVFHQNWLCHTWFSSLSTCHLKLASYVYIIIIIIIIIIIVVVVVVVLVGT